MMGRDEEMNRWVALVKGEYLEMPGLQLTRAQVGRLWGLEPDVRDELLTTLEALHFLRADGQGRYVLADSETSVACTV